jgi:hypothetical protein
MSIKFEQLKSIIPNDVIFFIDSENGEDEYQNKYNIPDEFNFMNVVYLSILDNALHIKLLNYNERSNIMNSNVKQDLINGIKENWKDSKEAYVFAICDYIKHFRFNYSDFELESMCNKNEIKDITEYVNKYGFGLTKEEYIELDARAKVYTYDLKDKIIKRAQNNVCNVTNTYVNTIKRNPFYDDTYSILYEFEDGRKEERKLVEFSETELLEIRYMIDKLLHKEN